MNQQNIIFESSPAYIIACVLVAVGFAFLLYRAKHPWSLKWNRILFGVRAVLGFLLTFLLLGPIVKQINNIFEKPFFIVLYDNSVSVKQAVDSTTLSKVKENLEGVAEALDKRGFDVKVNNLLGEEIQEPE